MSEVHGKPVPIEYEAVTKESLARTQRWLASLTKMQVLEYAERKMMPRDFMLSSWKRARKAQRKP